MGSDRARVTHDPQQQYRGVVMQQGRVTLEADWNEQLQIAAEEQRAEAQDIIGPSGTPDDGYAISAGTSALGQYDFSIGKGTMYVGGVRVILPADARYSAQADGTQTNVVLADWLDGPIDPRDSGVPHDPYWVDPTQPASGNAKQELICLMLREQEVSAVEDAALREVALGGPDTAQRLRLLQRVVRFATGATDCSGALADAKARWAQDGLVFDVDPHAGQGAAGNSTQETKDNQLRSLATLQVSYQPLTNPPDICQPDGRGGYLEADNQLICVQIADQNKILWGFDDASFLYRVDVVDSQRLHLQSRPVDAYHQPRAQQVVEVLRSAAKLSNGEYIASATGIPVKLASPYDPDKRQISLAPASLPQTYQDAKLTPRVFLRVWEDRLTFTPGTAVTLGNTGLQVTLQVPAGSTFHVGDYWLIAARPSTPQQVYPQRLLQAPQPPDGPRMWACPLAVIEGIGADLKVIPNGDCRNHFCTLVEARQERESACCAISVWPENLDADHYYLHNTINTLPPFVQATICLAPGTYTLPEPLHIGSTHSNLTIEGCQDGVILQAAPKQLDKFRDGLIVLTRANNVTLRNLRFDLPLVSFASTKSKFVRLEPRESIGISSAVQEALVVSIGVRPVHCARLTIEDCLFRFALAQHPHVFAAGVFAAGECWGLSVHRNRFMREENYLRVNEDNKALFRVLVGYLLAPSIMPRVGAAGAMGTTATTGGGLLRTLLQDASFQKNLFAGLTHAIYIIADAGTLTCEDNTVRDCHNGIWFASLSGQAYAEFLERVEPILTAAVPTREIPASLIRATASAGAMFARHYPLPSEFASNHIVPVPTPKGVAAVKASADRIRGMFIRSLKLLGAHVPPRTIPTTSSESPQPEERLTVLTPIHRAAQELKLSAFERIGFVRQVATRTGLHLSLHLAQNDVALLVPTTLTSYESAASGPPAGIGVLVWTSERDVDSAVTMTANRLRSRSRYLPVGGLIHLKRCTLASNLVTNELVTGKQRMGASDLSSLVVCMAPDAVAGAAVTGNVFRGKPTLPARIFQPWAFPDSIPLPPPGPMDRWEFLNTIM